MMNFIEIVSFLLMGTLCIQCTKSDLKSGLIYNRILAIFLVCAVILDAVYYGFYAKDLFRDFVFNFLIVSVLSLYLFFSHSFAGGDCKLAIVLTMLYPARYYLNYRGNAATLVFAIGLALFAGYCYLLVYSVFSIAMASSLSIKKQGITEMDVDCIVNAANGQLQHGGGVCGAIFAAAGAEELQAACDIYGGCPTGDVVITSGFKLKAKYIIHAVGPIWQGGHKNEEKLLYSCYQKAMKVAHCNGCRSIAFPLISSGIYGYPKEEAWRVTIKAIQDSPYDLDVTITVIDDKAFQLGTSILPEMMPKGVDNSAGFQFFWHEYDAFGEFSQWFKSPFVVEGILYETAEQYMMAKKALLFGDLIRYSLIMNEPDPSKCKKLGQLVQNFDGKVWDSCKEEIIYNANMAKFSQNERAKQLLLSTGDKIIAEASPYDKVWGIRMEANDPNSTNPAKWKGENLLGKALMKVRDRLKSE